MQPDSNSDNSNEMPKWGDLTADLLESFEGGVLRITSPVKYEEIPEHERSLLFLRMSSNQGLTTRTGLIKRVTEFVHISSLTNNPVSLASLNRRFGKVALKMGTSVRTVVDGLISTRTFSLIAKRNTVAVFSQSVLDASPGLTKTNLMNNII